MSLGSTPTSKLIIHYALKGSAISDFDYQPVSGKVKIKPGHTSATISVYPYDESINDGSAVTLKAVLLPGNGYTVRSLGIAKSKTTNDK